VKKRKLTEILVETVETIIVRRKPKADDGPLTAWCAECEREVSLISPEAIAALTGASTRTIYRQIEAGRLHFIELADGRLLICLVAAAKTAATKQ